MKRLSCLAAGLALALLIGCDGQRVQEFQEIKSPEPLTMEQWKQLPRVEKFDPHSLERLKAGEPQLKDPKAWREFERTVLADEFQKGAGP